MTAENDSREHELDISAVAELERYSPEVRAQCSSIADSIAAVDAGERVEGATRAQRVRAHLVQHHGLAFSDRQVYRYLARYRKAGVAGLADGRKVTSTRQPRTDTRVYELIEAELKTLQTTSTGTRSRAITRIRWEASRREIPLPSDRTLYRLLEQLDRKRGSFDDATTRRSKASRPDRTFHPVTPSRPGEIVEIDATPLDLFVQMPDGTVARPELTYAIDVATSTIGATLLHAKAAKSVDIGAVLLARMLTRVETQSWWNDAISLAERLFEEQSDPVRPALEAAAARTPLIVPESVTVDRGKVFVGTVFTAACERLEISQTRANPRQATDKPHVEGGFKRIREGFVQYLAGYTGGNVLDRAKDPQREALWTLGEVQLLLDLWVIAHWQTTPQSGLRVAGMPRRTLSPNQMYSALSSTAPNVPVHLSRDDYISLLPLAWRTIQSYGINFGGLTYDADELHPMRGRRSRIRGEARGRWEVRYDPYNLRQVWIRDEAGDRWITAPWGLAAQTSHPFSHEVLRAAQRALVDTEHARNIDVLEQINRIQSQRPPAQKTTKSIRRAATERDVPGLRIVEAPDASTPNAPAWPTSERAVPTTRLAILD